MLSIPQLESKIRRHWTEFLPERVKALKAEGMLEFRVRQTATEAHQMMRDLMRQGWPELAAEEKALTELVLLPPEHDPEDEETQEMEAMEREHQETEAAVAKAVAEYDAREAKAERERKRKGLKAAPED